MYFGAPVITAIRVIPVAGRDGMLLNLSGAHGPYFMRNIVILTDSAGNTGLGEVPGGEPIRTTLEDAQELILGQMCHESADLGLALEQSLRYLAGDVYLGGR